MFTAVAAFFARSALMSSPVGGLLKAVPRWAWIALAGALALLGAYLWHQHAAHKALDAAYARGRDDYAAKVEAHARSIEAKAADLAARINQPIRDKLNENLGRIHADADAVRLRGPGAAECRDPRFSAAAGGPQQAGGPADAALPKVPYPEWSALIAMPLSTGVGFAEQHDAFREEVISWRTWYPQMVDWTKQLQKEHGDKPGSK